VAAPADPAFAAELSRAEQELAAGAIEPARARLLRLEASGHRETQLLFLLGMTAFVTKDYPEAIRHFRAILAREPGASRVRLELARTFYEARDWRNAERQFRFARAGDLPPVVAGKVDGYLAQIRRQRTFTFGFSVALAPDSNVNAGPSAENVTLYGLPFQLDQDARASSGVGFALAAQTAWTPRLSESWRWDVTANGYSRLYTKARFDEAALVLATGPHLVRERIDASLHVTATRRWFAGDVYAKAYGGVLDATWYLTGRTALTGSAELAHVDYPSFAAQTGPVVNLSVGVLRALTAASYGRVGLSLGREDAQDSAFANRSIGLDTGYVREFGAGITASLGGRVRLSRYDEAALAFGAKRRDEQYVLQAGLTLRKLQLRGLAPSVTVTETINNSNITLYRFRRARVEFGLTRTF
jgi:hypothetical protein